MLKIFSLDLPYLEELHFGEYYEWDKSIRDLDKTPQVLN